MLVSLVFAAPAEAHRVNIFAWLEGDSILVECAYNKQNPVREGMVTVYDSTDNRELLSGKTNAEGRFSFKVPEIVRQGHGLRIQVNAGQGHVNQWNMEAAELYEAAALTAGFDDAALKAAAKAATGAPLQTSDSPKAEEDRKEVNELAVTAVNDPNAISNGQNSQPRDVASRSAKNSQSAVQVAALDASELRKILHEELESKLGPLRRELAARLDSGPGISEIIGGLGWIIGLIGIGMYFKNRRG